MKICFTQSTLKDTFYALTPVNSLLRCTGLSNIYRDGIQLAESGSITKTLIYIIVLGVLNVIVLSYKIQSFQGNRETGLIRFSDAIKVTYWLSYFEYVIDLYFVYRYGRNLLLKYFKSFDHIDALLGSPCYHKIRKIIIKSIIVSVVIFIFNSMFDYLIWVYLVGWSRAAAYSVDFLYFFLNVFTILDIISHVIQVEYRLKMLNKSLQGYNIIKPITNTDEPDGVSQAKHASLNAIATLNHPDITRFSKCYLQLLKQVTYLNKIYGFRVLLYCINLLINMTCLLNLAIRIISRSMSDFDSNIDVSYNVSLLYMIVVTMSSIVRALNYALMAIILIYRCEQTYKESEKILETIDDLLINDNNCYIKINLLDIRNLIITRPVKFHASRFFTIDYTLLVSLNSVVITYTIIMVQSLK